MDVLTIVIPTRDRPSLLELALRSVRSGQAGAAAPVIVSDNSTREHPEITGLRSRFGFEYVRQSGRLSQTEHLNACIKLPGSRWMYLLHDDDELFPGALPRLLSFLSHCDSAGIVVGGVEHIDPVGNPIKRWMPRHAGIYRGEDGLARLGLDWGVRPPGVVLNPRAADSVGSYEDVHRVACDYALDIRLAFHHGVVFFPEVIGRFRQGPQQMTDFSSPEKVDSWLEFSMSQGEVARQIGCSDAVSDRVLDYLTWWTFSGLVPPLLAAHPEYAFRLADKCLARSPHRGEWQNMVRMRHPILFVRPRWAALAGLKVGRKVRSYQRRVTGASTGPVRHAESPYVSKSAPSRNVS